MSRETVEVIDIRDSMAVKCRQAGMNNELVLSDVRSTTITRNSLFQIAAAAV